MTGGLLQLAAYGSQDVYLTGNPQITFFKMVYRRYTNFSIETIDQVLDGPPSLAQSTNIQLKCKINRNGDLINQIYFVFDIPNIFSSYAANKQSFSTQSNTPDTDNDSNCTEEESYTATAPQIIPKIKNINYKFKWIKNLGTSIIHKVNISIGGQIIDEHFGDWLNIWSELNIPYDRQDSYNILTGNIPEIYDPANSIGNNGFYPSSSLNPTHVTDPDDFTKKLNPYRAPPSIQKRTIYVPLNFWFCQYTGQCLPLVALQYHDIEIVLELRPIIDLYNIIETNLGEEIEQGQYTKPNPLRADQNIANFISQTYGTDAYNILYDQEVVDSCNNADNSIYEIVSSGNWSLNPKLTINYVFLEEAERKRFANSTHEYLIEQVTRFPYYGLTGMKTLDIPAQHPVKKIIFTTQRNDIKTRNDWTNYTNWITEEVPPWAVGNEIFQSTINKYISKSKTSAFYIGLLSESSSRLIPNKGNAKYFQKDILQNAELLFNGVSRQSLRDNIYFNYLQPYQSSMRNPKTGIYVYSFALQDTSEYQPKGSCNFSRLKTVQLDVSLTDAPPAYSDNSTLQYSYMYDINVYTVSYNVLRIMSGMGSLAFAN